MGVNAMKTAPIEMAALNAWGGLYARQKEFQVVAQDACRTLRTVRDTITSDQLAELQKVLDSARPDALRLDQAVTWIATPVDRLPSPAREVMTLRYRDGLPWKQIQRILGLSKRDVLAAWQEGLRLYRLE